MSDESQLEDCEEYRAALDRWHRAEQAAQDFTATARDAGKPTGILLQKPAPDLGVIHVTREWSEQHRRVCDAFSKADRELGMLRRRLLAERQAESERVVWTDVEAAEYGQRFIVDLDERNVVIGYESYDKAGSGPDAWAWGYFHDDVQLLFPRTKLPDVIAALQRLLKEAP